MLTESRKHSVYGTFLFEGIMQCTFDYQVKTDTSVLFVIHTNTCVIEEIYRFV